MKEVRHQFPGIGINLTGEPVLDYDEMRQSQSDATKATVLTAVPSSCCTPSRSPE